MKKKLIVAITAVSIIAGLSACNGGNGASTQNTPERDFADMTENYIPPQPVVDAAFGAFGLLYHPEAGEEVR